MTSLTIPTVHAAAATRDALATGWESVRAAWEPTSTDDPRLISVSVAVAWDDPVSWFDAAQRTGADTMLRSEPATDRWLVGIGGAVDFPVAGPDRFQAAAARWRALLASHLAGGPAAGLPGAGPVLVGGATYADHPSRDACWAGFEVGHLVVPALLIRVDAGQAVLTMSIVATTPEGAEAGARDALGLVDPIITTMRTGSRSSGTDPLPRLHQELEAPGRAEWSSWVARSSGAVGRGRLDKVVLARRVDLRSETPIEVAAVLDRLIRSGHIGAPAPVTVFAVGRAGGTFLGASPERLVEVAGRRFRTIALAGTAARADDPDDDVLLGASLQGSEKDREEHAVVVAMLRETLAPVATTMRIDDGPRVIRLPTVQHLATDITGALRDGVDILDLVDRLHPTPAVGGWPRIAALELLEEQERLDRGWYAGPIGWVDANGDGAFDVGIRSGVVAAHRVSLFAGCGIVADSEPDREWAESGLKLMALGSAIGTIEPDDGLTR